jgi:hypothetical protein
MKDGQWFFLEVSKRDWRLLQACLWQCPTCRKIWCETCPKQKIGRLFKKLVCPECHIEMQEGGLTTVKRAIRP